MNQKKEQILAALKKLGPSSPGAIANMTSIEPSLCGYHLRGLLKTGALKASGSSNNRVYALPDQTLDGAPQTLKYKKKKGGKHRGRKTASTTRARPAADPAAGFIPGLTANGGLVLVGHTPAAAPIIFNPEQTGKLADLLLAHYEA